MQVHRAPAIAFGLVLAVALCLLGAGGSIAAAGFSLFVGATQVSGLPAPVVAQDRILVPADLLHFLGAQNVSISATSVRFRSDQDDVLIKVGESLAQVNGKSIDMGAKAVRENDTLYLPLRFLAEVLNLRMSWEQSSGALHLTEHMPTVTKAPPSTSKVDPPASGGKAAVNTVPSVAPAKIAAPAPPKPTPAAPLPGVASAVVATSGPNAVPDPGRLNEVQSAAVQSAAVQSVQEQNRFTGEVSHLFAGASGARLNVSAKLDADLPVFDLAGVKPDALTITLYPAPNRLVIDIKGVVPADGLEPWTIGFPNVNRVRFAPYKGQGRLVLELNDPAGYRVTPVTGGVRITLNRILHAVSFIPSSAGGRLSLDLPAGVPYKTQRLTAPDRLVVDLPDTTLAGAARTIDVAAGPVKAVRVSQFNAQTTRVVLDLQKSIGSPWPVQGEQLQLLFNAEIADISIVDLGGGRQVVLVEGVGPMNGTLSRLHDPERVVLDIANASAAHSFGELNPSAGLVNQLRAAQFMPDTYRVVANVDAGSRARLVELGQGKLALLVEDATLQGSRIVVDAGHGGADPGAIGKSMGLRESEVNLAIALQLETLLKQASADVSLVRTDNNSVFLADRPVLSAKFHPDIFISIHSNSTVEETTASGPETLYWNLEDSSASLAQAIEDEVAAATGAVNRGIKRQNLLVLRESDVPAVLVEVGFLSNPADERRLADPLFQRKVAEGIFNGIVKYLQPGQTRDVAAAPVNAQDLWQKVQQNANRTYMPNGATGLEGEVAPQPVALTPTPPLERTPESDLVARSAGTPGISR